MKTLIIKYKHSKTLFQYLIFGIIMKLVYFFKRDLLQQHVEILELNITVDKWHQTHTIKKKLVKHVYDSQNYGKRRPELTLLLMNFNNYFYSDDIFLWYKELDPDSSLFFQPNFDLFKRSQQIEPKNTNLLYDIKLFVASHAYMKPNNLSTRFYYLKVLDRLAETSNPKSIIPYDPVRLFFKLYIPSIGDILILAKSALSAKLTRHSLKIPVCPDAERKQFKKTYEIKPNRWQNVIITGWYGTETNGDKAILGELVHFIKTFSPNCCITITSICPMVSYQTNKELTDLSDAKIVDLKEAANSSIISETDSVIIGGGPLMDSSLLKYILSLFEEAFKKNKPRIIFGCGIGPIHKEETRGIVKQILELATAGFLRDKESHDYATSLYPKHTLKLACDPAFGYITRWRKNAAIVKENNYQIKIAGLLRANTREFRNDLDKDQLENSNEIAASQIAGIVEPVCCEKNARFELLHMNAPWLGGDDRIFNRRIEKFFKEAERVNVVREYLTLEEHLQRLYSADVSVAMRYHGHIFSIALGIPFLSINYTGLKGKVGSLIDLIGYKEYCVSWAEIDILKSQKQLLNLIENRVMISSYLLAQTALLNKILNNAYCEVFGVDLNDLS